MVFPGKIPQKRQVAAVADLNGDGQPDLLLFNPQTRFNVVWFMNGITHASSAYLTDASSNKIALPGGFGIVAP